MLEVRGLNAEYGPVQVLRGIDLTVAQGELVALIGSNGAGKTTLLRTVSGLQPAAAGRISFGGNDISRASAEHRVALGIAQVPEGRQVFTALSVEDNLHLGAYARGRPECGETLAQVYGMFPPLAERRDSMAGMLSGGQQQMLAIGRALMAKPRLLLMDEPSMGLAPQMVEQIYDVILGLRRSGTTILLVEQNADAALAVADRAYVIETGRIVIEGAGRELLTNDGVRRAYLG